MNTQTQLVGIGHGLSVRPTTTGQSLSRRQPEEP